MRSTISHERVIALDIHRYHPERDAHPHIERFEVPFRDDWVVLDALNYIKEQVDGTLTYRWSCRMGVCGSCGMRVNDVAKLTCSTFLRDYYPNPVRIEPLRHFPVERDLVVAIDAFLEKLQAIEPWLIREDELPVEAGEYLQTPAQLLDYQQFSQCINCLLCMDACPVPEWQERFLGPAALALSRRWDIDSRQQGHHRREVAWGEHGIWDCVFVGQCSVVCPKHVDPAGAIQQTKVQSTIDWWSALLPGRRRVTR